jgi:hypothetical protein
MIDSKNKTKGRHHLLIKPSLILGIALLLYGMVCGIALEYIWPGWDFSKSGPMGDTIAGIAGPIINLIGAILVYLSFQQQKDANQMQIDALTEDRNRANLLNKFNQLVNLMNDIEMIATGFTVHFLNKKTGDYLQSKNGIEALRELSGKICLLKKDKDYPPLLDKELNEYISWLRIVLFTANGVTNYSSSEDHSQKILQMKFVNLMSKYTPKIAAIYKNAYAPSNEGLMNREIIDISNQTYALIKTLEEAVKIE